MVTREIVIDKLGITESDLNDKNITKLVDTVVRTANILEDVDFALRENATEIVESGKVIASVYNVVFWKENE